MLLVLWVCWMWLDELGWHLLLAAICRDIAVIRWNVCVTVIVLLEILI